MSDINNSSSSESMKKDDNNDDDDVIHEQTNPSFHDTPEDNRNYKSLQTKSISTGKKSNFILKPSLLTQKAEQIRTDKSSIISAGPNSTAASKFLVLNNSSSPAPITDPVGNETVKSTETTVKSSFVFGENIFARVVQPDCQKSSDQSAKRFQDLIVSRDEKEAAEKVHETDTDALRKSADECAQKSIALASLEETEIVTGEENETSVLKTLCKLFLFASDRNEWIEKGFCNVHVNDTIDERVVTRSRLVVRSKGGLKVLVNTVIWAEMGLARASVKAVRITAQSETGLQSFLLTMQNAGDADSLFRVISARKSRLAAVNCNSKSIDRKRSLSEDSNNDDGSDLIKKRIK